MAGYLDDDATDPAMAAPAHDDEVALAIDLALSSSTGDEIARARLDRYLERQSNLSALTRAIGRRPRRGAP